VHKITSEQRTAELNLTRTTVTHHGMRDHN